MTDPDVEASSIPATIDGGVFVVHGRLVFVVGLSNGPANPAAWRRLRAQGVNLLRYDPGRLHRTDGRVLPVWTAARIGQAHRFDVRARASGMMTMIKLDEAASFLPGSPAAAVQARIIDTLGGDPALAFWKGVDEPNARGSPTSGRAMVFAYRQARRLDRGRHIWLTVESASHRRPPAVVGVQGVDVNPVGWRIERPMLSHVGTYTRRLRARLTTIGVCDTKSRSPSGRVVEATAAQMRFMVFDAVINGARGINFFGLGRPMCWTRADVRAGWGWSEWNRSIRPVVQQLTQPGLAPALVAPAGPAIRAPGLAVASRRTGTELLVLSANPHPRPRLATLRLPGGTTIRTRYLPWQVRIFSADTRPPAAETPPRG